MIWGKFLASGKLCTAFFTGFGFLTIRVNLKQNDSCAECFDANFEKHDSCARCFKKVLACKEMSPISIKTRVKQTDFGPIWNKRKFVQSVFHTFWLPNNTGQFQAKRRLRRKFRATGELRTVFCTSFSFLTKSTNFD